MLATFRIVREFNLGNDKKCPHCYDRYVLMGCVSMTMLNVYYWS